MPGRATVEQIVAGVLEHGSLHGAGYARTCTLEGKRRITVRLTSDVCNVVATAPGGRDDERNAKRSRHHHRFCPLCSSSPKPLSGGRHGG